MLLSQRDLNRILLSRQMLLERAAIPVLGAVTQLTGLQSQIPNPPYISLWTRLQTFALNDLTQLMEDRQIVRAAMLRSTLHLVTAADHHRFQPVLQPALDRALSAFFGKSAKGLDIDRLVAIARPFLEEAPRTTGEIRDKLLEIESERDGQALAYAVRNKLPQVQVPPGGTWGSGTRASYTTAEAWLGPMESPGDLRELFFRYLAAFGPATVMDFQTWTGMTRLKSAIEALRPELQVYQSEDGKELFDLPDQPLPPADTPAPPRFIPEYDNLLVAHADRTRIIADADRKKVFLSAARVLPTILVDGFVAGTWKSSREKETAVLTVSPFAPLSPDVQTALVEEGERLIRFIEGNATAYAVRFTLDR